jgi:hypothetical protein
MEIKPYSPNYLLGFPSSPAASLARQFEARYVDKFHSNNGDVCRVAMFLSDVSDDVRDLRGERVKKVGFAANQLIKTCGNVLDTVQIIENFITIPALIDHGMVVEIQAMVKQVTLMIWNVGKFTEHLQKLGLEETTHDTPGFKDVF